VRHTDRADESLLLQGDERAPGVAEGAEPGRRPVHEVDVDDPESEPFHRVLAGGDRGVVLLLTGAQLGDDDDLLALETRGAYRPADTFLVAVCSGGVDVAVAGGERGGNSGLDI